MPFLAAYHWHLIFAIIALIVAAGATLVIPIAVRRIIDHGFSSEGGALVDRYFLAMLAVVLVLALASAVRFYLVTWLGERIVADVRDRVFAHLLDLSPAFYERSRTGEVVSRLTADTTQVKAAFSTSASIALRNAAMFIGAIVMMFATSPKLSGLVLLAIPLIVLPLVMFGRRVRSLSRIAQDTLADSAAFAQERLTAIGAVQSFVQEDFTRRQFAAATERAFASAARRTMARAFLTAAIIALSLGSVVMVLWYGAQDVIAGSMIAGQRSASSCSMRCSQRVRSANSRRSGARSRRRPAPPSACPNFSTRSRRSGRPPRRCHFPSPPRGRRRLRECDFHYPTRP